MTEARAYELVLRQKVIQPIITATEERLREARRRFGSIQATIDAIPVPTHPALRGRAYTAASQFTRRLRAYHRQRLHKTLGRLLGVDVDLLGDAAIKPIIERSIEDNVDLIRTIPTRYHASLRRDLLKLAGDVPFDEERLSALLAKSYGSSGYNLRRLSRDQTSKLVGRLSQARQEQLGVRSYRWSTSKDNRVRQTHQANEGLEFAWETPPSTGHPGFEVQCRCISLPLIRPGRSRAPAPPPPTATPPPPPTAARSLQAAEVRTLAEALRRAPRVNKFETRDPLARFWARREFGSQRIASVGDKAYDAIPGDPLFRGFRSPDDAVEIIEGKWVSKGSWGSGQGFVRDRARLASYGDDVLEIKLKRGAKVVDYEDVLAERRAFLRDLDDVTGLSAAEIERVREFADDSGRFAAYRGYDAIRVVDDGRIVLVNFRAAVIRRSLRKRLYGFDVQTSKREIREALDRVVALGRDADTALARLQLAPAGKTEDLVSEYGEALRQQEKARARLLARVESARKKTRTAAEVEATLDKIRIPADGPEAWRRGARSFAETAHPKVASDIRVRIGPTNRRRSWQRGTESVGDIAEIGMAAGRGADIVAHELGHALETSNRGLFDAAVDLLRAKHAKGPRYRDNARVIDVVDDFFGPSWYPAKYYEHTTSPWLREVDFPGGKRTEMIRATEVVSSALEYFVRDPKKFAEQAPEFFWWTIDRIVLPD